MYNGLGNHRYRWMPRPIPRHAAHKYADGSNWKWSWLPARIAAFWKLETHPRFSRDLFAKRHVMPDIIVEVRLPLMPTPTIIGQ
jgi:hypothetical protein